MLDPEEIVYSINIGDIQAVAMDNLHRELTEDELKKVLEPAFNRFNWYESVSDAISDKIGVYDGDEYEDED